MSPRRRSPLTIEYILLGLLFHDPKHGYELHKEIKESQGLSHIWRIKPSKLYSLLDRLEIQGLLLSRSVPSEKTPARKEFQLTQEGETVFLDWIQAPVGSGRHMRLVFHARLFFAMKIGEEQAINLISVQRDECREWVESMQAQLAAFENPDFTTGQVFTYRINQVEAMLDWLDDCESHIRAGSQVQARE
jgi:PadR family transcriptional regulator AphA